MKHINLKPTIKYSFKCIGDNVKHFITTSTQIRKFNHRAFIDLVSQSIHYIADIYKVFKNPYYQTAIMSQQYLLIHEEISNLPYTLCVPVGYKLDDLIVWISSNGSPIHDYIIMYDLLSLDCQLGITLTGRIIKGSLYNHPILCDLGLCAQPTDDELKMCKQFIQNNIDTLNIINNYNTHIIRPNWYEMCDIIESFERWR